MLGHSVGGQIIGFYPGVPPVDAFVLIAAQCPAISNWEDPIVRLKVRAIWSLVFPGVCRALGYLPGSEAVDALLAGFTRARIERIHLSPRDVGLDSLGHAGFFAQRASRLWAELVDFMDRRGRGRGPATGS